MDFAALTDGNVITSIEQTRTREEGGRHVIIRGRFAARFAIGGTAIVLPPKERSADDAEPDNRAPIDAPDNEPANRQEDVPMTGLARIRGIASSTGVDWYGTEMTHEALQSMQRQFSSDRGVAYAPTHWESEWHEIAGRTVGADIQRVERVDNAAAETEQQFVLWVDSDINLARKRGHELICALRDGFDVGQSIGGWFTSLTFQYNDQDELDRIFVNDVELDHLAATRTPANSDSTGLDEIRTHLIGEIRTRFIAAPAPAARAAETVPPVAAEPPAATAPLSARGKGAPDQRHVVSVMETENTVVTQYLKVGKSEADLDDAELLGETGDRANPEPETRAEPDPEPEPEPEPDDRAQHCDTNADCTGDEHCVDGSCTRCVEAAAEAAARDTPEPEPESTETAPEPDPTSPDEAPAESTDNPEESAMTKEELAAFALMIGSAVGDALDARGVGAAPSAETDPEPDPEPEKSEREKELEAELARATRDLTLRNQLVDRLADAPRGRARQYEDVELLAATVAIEHGDFEPLIERAKEEAVRPMTVRVMETNKNIRKVLDGFEDHEDATRKVSFKHIKRSLVTVFRAFEADGGFTRDQAANWRN